jgi:hypothetical protein
MKQKPDKRRRRAGRAGQTPRSFDEGAGPQHHEAVRCTKHHAGREGAASLPVGLEGILPARRHSRHLPGPRQNGFAIGSERSTSSTGSGARPSSASCERGADRGNASVPMPIALSAKPTYLCPLPRTTFFVAFVILGSAACAADPEIERRGGPPVQPTKEAPSAGTGGASAGTGGALAGTGGASAGAGGNVGVAGSPIAFCDALTVVRNKCQRCHGEPLENGAPIPLLSIDDFHAQYGTSEFEYWQVAEGLVERDVMPYVVLNDPPTSLMPPVARLTDAEKRTLLGWLQQGARPVGQTECE